jgi:hypothetical protein
VTALRWAVGGLLVAAGAGKLASADAARLAPVLLGNATGMVVRFLDAAEHALPGIELVTGLATVLGVGRGARHLLATGLAVAFATAGALLPAGVRCGCLGVLGGFESRTGHVAASGALLALAIGLWAAERSAAARGAGPGGSPGYDRISKEGRKPGEGNPA